MENIKNVFLEEEPMISDCCTMSNYGVCSKNVKIQRNIHISFSPHSSNNIISFTNTIMIPNISTEVSMDTDKTYNKKISYSQNEKSKYSTRKNNTRIKTESSKEEKNIYSYEHQTAKNKIANNENEENDENIIFIDTQSKKENECLEKNPFYLGEKAALGLNKEQKDDSEIEKKKIKKLLNKDKLSIFNEDDNTNYKRKKKERKELCEEYNKNKLKNKIKRLKSSDLAKVVNIVNSDKDHTGKNSMKYKRVYKINNENEEAQNPKLIKRQRNTDKNIKTYGKTESKKKINEKIIKSKSPKNFVNKEYKASMFNINNTKLKEKKELNKNKGKKEGKEKASKNIIFFNYKYKGISHTSLKIGFGIETPKNKLDEAEIRKKTDDQLKRYNFEEPKKKDLLINTKSNIKRSYKNLFTSKIKKVKTIPKELNSAESKKNPSTFKRNSVAAIKKLDFELALKNKNNLAKTQYNLFSPDKFTNTEFCGSDYCEYTLECMDLILNKNKTPKQQKSKVNFNFPKPKGNRPKKKIALFDLDETLVHCTGDIELKKEQSQHHIEITLPNNKTSKVGINIRPLWRKTLNLIKKYYHIVVFTASHQCYADAVLNFMDPSNKYFKYRLYRNNCSFVDIDGTQFYVKDLDIFDEFYDLKDIIIIDNSVLSFIYHLENGIPIVPYYNEDKDGSLYVVGLYLMHIYKEDDLREANKKFINLESFLKEAKARKENNSSMTEGSINNNHENETNKSIEKDITHDITAIKTEMKNTINNNANTRRCSYSNEKTQNKLISQSKLINLYYELNYRAISSKKNTETIEEMSNKSLSVDNEKELDDNEKNKNGVECFFDKKYLTSIENNNINTVKNAKTNNDSNKTLHNYFNFKKIRENFNYNFSNKTLFNK